MSRVFQEQTPSPSVHSGIQVDRKLMAKIREKKIAAGHKPDGRAITSLFRIVQLYDLAALPARTSRGLLRCPGSAQAGSPSQPPKATATLNFSWTAGIT